MKLFTQNTVLLLLVSVLITLMPATAQAENMKKLGSMNVHYIALGATFLTPEIAQAYGIQRSKYNGPYQYFSIR